MTDLRLKPHNTLEALPQEQLIIFTRQVQQLSLKIDFQNHEDVLEVYNLLNKYFNYPSSQQAQVHRQANRLGILDIKKTSKYSKGQLTNVSYVRSQNKICNCCGFFLQDEELKLCNNDLHEANNIGASTIVFFKTFFNIAWLLVALLLVYSIFSFATNLIQSNRFLKNDNKLYYLIISLAAKASIHNPEEQGRIYYLISSILSLPLIIIWFIMFIFMKKSIKKIENQEKSYSSAADFSVLIQNIPTGLSKEQLQTMLDQYSRKLEERDDDIKTFKLQKYNEARPFYLNEEEFQDNQLQQLIDEIKQVNKEFVSWIYQRQEEEDFFTTKEYRHRRYQKYELLRKQLIKKQQKIRQNIKQQLLHKHKQAKTYVFLTFQTIEQRDLFLSLNKKDFFSTFKNYLPCYKNPNSFKVKKNNVDFDHLYIEQAPHPQDIIWSNAGLNYCQSFGRKFLTFGLTFIMIGISFAIVYGLSRVERQNSQNRYISILISLVIGIINLIIIKIIQYTTIIQRIFTNNHYQISIAIKSVLAQLVNSIIVPLIVNYNIKENIYQKGGLTEDIFILAIFNSFLPPLVRALDPYGIYVYLRFVYYDRPINKIRLIRSQLNNLAEKPQFQVGSQYIYLISNFLFICFYVSLQPVIPLFGIAGLFLMYWINKYSLYGRSQRPIPGNDTLGFAMYQMLFFGPAALALGHLVWSRFLSDDGFGGRSILIINLIAIGLAGIAFIFPYEIFSDYKQNINKAKIYNQRRIYFTSEYDRLNPVTYHQGIQQYKSFLQRKKKEIQNLPIAEQDQFLEGLLNVGRNNVYKGNNINKLFYKGQSDNIINLLIQNQSKNTLDPKALASYLMPRAISEGLAALAQNKWNKNQQEYSLRGNKSSIDKKPNSQIGNHNNQKNAFRNLLSLGLRNQENKNDDVNNIYASNLKLNEQLGLVSKIIEKDNRKSNL